MSNNSNFSQITPFNYQSKEVRVLQDENGDPWWVAKDVCDVLDIKNITAAVQQLDEDERSSQNLGRQGEVNLISESGLYTLIIRSNKPDAKKFRKWVTSEVLPSIRKTGSYHTNAHPDGTKYCRKCDTVKPLSEFANHFGKRDGKAPSCRECCNETARIRYHRLKGKHVTAQLRIAKGIRPRREGDLSEVDTRELVGDLFNNGATFVDVIHEYVGTMREIMKRCDPRRPQVEVIKGKDQ